MIKILIVDKNRLFRQCLKKVLETEGIAHVLADVECIEYLLPMQLENSPDILLTDIEGKLSEFDILKRIMAQYPELKCITMEYSEVPKIHDLLISAGIKGYVPKDAELTELFTAIKVVESGKIYFPQEFLQKVINHHQINSEKKDKVLSSRELQILHLLCTGLSNEEISEILHLSYDTIKWHRSNILSKSGCKNILSLYKFAIKQRLVDPFNTEDAHQFHQT
jgi:DNA-binding NarL/FixJ family response regulator